MTTSPWAYGAERDGCFEGVCAADSPSVSEFLADCAKQGCIIKTFMSREEYRAWLDPLPVASAAERAKRGE